MKVIIMRGLPGSGKSTWAKKNYPVAVVCSADDTHTEVDGTYNFKPENAKKAHDDCLKKFLNYARPDGFSQVVVVDNTNTTAWEIAPYYRLAEIFGHEVEIVYLRASVTEALMYGTHNVPEETILRMQQNLVDERLPPWWKRTTIESMYGADTQSGD